MSEVAEHVPDAEETAPAGWPYRPDPLYRLPPTLPGGRAWPKISVVTPTYNQGPYIEQTILSVAHQAYPNLEHIVIDGGSTDETLAILDRHRAKLAYAVSEKDKGQSHAINKGMAQATGEIVTWLNSDDMFAPGALAAAAMAFLTSGADMVAGICELYRDGILQNRHLTSCADGPLPIDDILDLDRGWNAGQFFYQPEVLFTREIWDRAGGAVAEDLYYSMDYDLWLRFAAAGARIHVIGRPIAMFRVHPEQKTHVAERFRAELISHRQAYLERTGFVPKTTRPEPHHDRSLRIAMVNDHGWKWGAGIAHERIAQACRLAGHTIEAVEFARPIGDDVSIDELLEEIIAIAPDIVLVGNVHGAGLRPMVFEAVAARWPTFVFLHDLWWVTGRCAYTGTCDQLNTGCDETCPTPDEYPKLAPSLIAQAWADKRLVLSEPRHPVLLAMSAWARDVALKALAVTPGAEVERTTLGLPTDVFRPVDRAVARSRLNLPADKFLVLCTATNFDDLRKGADRVRALIEATHGRDIAFVTVGHGKIEGLEATRAEVIVFPYKKKPEEVAELYAAVDLVLAPSREETLGQIYIEAAACGTPSLAYATTGVVDAVLDGVTGTLVRGETPEALVACFRSLMEDRSRIEHMRMWARLHAENSWSLESCYRSLFQVLRRQGLVDRFGHAHKIGLRQDRDVGRVRTSAAIETYWTPESGVGPEEGPYPAHEIDNRFRWLFAPEATFAVRAVRTGPHVLVFRVQNRLVEQQVMSVLCDGATIATFSLPRRRLDDFDICTVDCYLHQGTHDVSLVFSEEFREVSPGTPALALMLDSFAIYSKAGMHRTNDDRETVLQTESV